jgi:homoserine kinase type II
MPSPVRARLTPELEAEFRRGFGLEWQGEPVDLGGFHHLNVLLPHADGGYVARVYAAWASIERVEAIQRARRYLLDAGLPFARSVSALDGTQLLTFGGHVIEVERYVPGEDMCTWRRMHVGMPMFARVHNVLRRTVAGDAARHAPHPNHVEARKARTWALRGVDAIRRHHSGPEELRCAELAEVLANEIEGPDVALNDGLPRQLVHGDFWDNNVLFQGDEIAIILDLDFMGERPRVDDLGLTLYYVGSTIVWEPSYFPDARQPEPFVPADHLGAFRQFVDEYDVALDEPLSAQERSALPLAMARLPLCFVGMVSLIEAGHGSQPSVPVSWGTEQARRLIPDLEWARDVVRELPRWQAAFA